MMRGGRVARTQANATAEDLQATAEFVGFWPCTDAGGLTVRDGSAYGNDLTIIPSNVHGVRDEEDFWGTNPGWLTLQHGDHATVTDQLNGALDTKDKVVVACCELKQENLFSDSDMGQAWEVGINNNGFNPDYLGFSLSAGGVGVLAFRVAIDHDVYDDGNPSWPTSRFTAGFSVPAPAPGPYGIAGVFRPSTPNISASLDGSALTTIAVNAAVTELKMSQADNGTFGLGTTYSWGASNGASRWTAVRNYQVWAFDSAPADLDATLQWMSANPGKLPGWWRS